MANVSSSNNLGERVPKLRFPDKNGNLPTDYTHYTIHDLFTRITQRNTKKITNVITNSAERGLIPQRDFFDKDIAVDGNTANYYVIKKGDFVYNPRKSNQAPYGPFNCYNYTDEGIVSPLYTCLRPKIREYTEFLLWYFKSPVWYSYIYHNGAQGGARHDRVGMTTELMDNIPINLPYISEQYKIVAFLNLIEKKITIQSKLVELLKLYKRGLLAKLFPKNGESMPQYRFEGFTGDWEQRKFEDIAQRMSNIGVSNKVTPSVEYEDVISGQGLLNKDVRQKEGMKIGIKFSEKEILYGKLRPYLHNWLNPDFQGIAVGDWWVLKPINADKTFLYRLIQTPYFDNMANQSLGTKMPRADWKLISGTEFCIPTEVNEQRKIGAYFQHIDTLITIHQCKYDTFHLLKNSLLQQMFI